jgi:hypothetical protein
MTNLALKLGIASGLAGALTLQGDERQARRVAPLEYAAAITAMSPDAAVVAWPLAAASQRLRTDVVPKASQDAATAFAAEIVRLSAAADAIDRLWHDYKAECGVRVGRQYDFGREWFSIWDRSAEATIDAPRCGDLLWRLMQEGETVRRDLLRARAAQDLDHGTEIGMLRWHALQWP